ncbi:hypothetical protein [Parapedobacter sp. 2B3]|uniref:hypothetical protein n=1 Tax=Parapedobacter sp. 2B3 TaxID=3342381 RepID=UPI0035B66DD5
MTHPNEILAVLLIGVIFTISSLMAFFSWKYAGYFLSRRDHYVNSRYELFMKKLGWSISAFFITLGLLGAAIKGFLA